MIEKKNEEKMGEKEKSDKTSVDNLSLLTKGKNWTLLVLVIASFFSWAAWGMILNKTSPFYSANIAIPLFYITSFFAVASTFALIATLLASSFSPRRSPQRVANISIRQGIILGAIVTTALIFQQFRVLTWWDASLLIAMGILVEISFLDKKS